MPKAKAAPRAVGFYKPPRKKCVMYHTSGGKNHHYTGLTKALALRAYPRYDRDAAYRLWKSRPLAERAAVKAHRDATSKDGALAIGDQTSVLLQQVFRLHTEFGVPLQAFLDANLNCAEATRILDTWPKTIGIRQRARELNSIARHRKPYVRDFLKWVLSCEYQLVGVEVPVGWAGEGVATKVDAVVRTRVLPYRYHVVEIKTGYCVMWHQQSAPGSALAPPFHEHPDTPFNQNHLQLAATASMFKATCPSCQMGTPLLVRLHHGFNGGVNSPYNPTGDVHLLPAWLHNEEAMRSLREMLVREGTTTAKPVTVAAVAIAAKAKVAAAAKRT